MQKIITTKDGSHSLVSTEFGETYHSIHGALQEAKHVFINYGLQYVAYRKNTISIFEMGFGTGLNAFLSMVYADRSNIDVNYHAIELYPVESLIINQLNYTLSETEDGIKKYTNAYKAMHNTVWEKEATISKSFKLTKIKNDLVSYNFSKNFDLIYYDAFAPATQPDLWTTEIFTKLYNNTNRGGILTTYCAKGAVRRNLQEAGFVVERLDGPIGKREMLRAQKQ